MNAAPFSPASRPRVASGGEDADVLLRGLGEGPFALVLACSSAGGFTFNGHDGDGVIAIAFPAGAFRAEAVWMSNLRQHMVLDWVVSLRDLVERFPQEPGQARFGLLLIDGTSGCEELVTATVDVALPELLVLGGSAGDGLCFGQTRLAMDGDDRMEGALFCMIATDFAVKEVVFDHFVPVGSRMIRAEAGDLTVEVLEKPVAEADLRRAVPAALRRRA